jgi:histone deacetylase 11
MWPSMKNLLLFILSLSFSQKMFCATNKIPFVYHPGYNISVFGLEKFHPFDTHKYRHVVEQLKNHFKWTDNQFHRPRPATDEELKEFHAPEYIDSLN